MFRFQSTLPVWGATYNYGIDLVSEGISIHAPRVGSDIMRDIDKKAESVISIHAPRVGSDPISQIPDLRTHYFNPRSPCGERRSSCCFCGAPSRFQSTLPVWGATRKETRAAGKQRHFNPRSPCGERPSGVHVIQHRRQFQSTLPVWGATWWLLRPRPRRRYFNPRSPCGERHRIGK